MYCIKCGTKQEEGEKFCPKCGTSFVEESAHVSSQNDFTPDTKEEILKKQVNRSFAEKCKDGLYGAVALFIPILGLIIYFVKRNKEKTLAKSILTCTIIGFVFNGIIFYENYSDEMINNDSYIESDYDADRYIEEEDTNSDLWKKYIGKWVYNIVLQPTDYTTIAGYGGSIYLTINTNGTAHLKLTSAEMGYEQVVIDSTGDIEMDGNVLIVHVNGGSPKFILKNNSVYTYDGEEMKRDY